MSTVVQQLDHTHNPTARSWVISANAGSDFPIQNLPLCRFEEAGESRVGCGIGDRILDLTAVAIAVELPESLRDALQYVAGGQMRPLMMAGSYAAKALRHALFAALSEDASDALQKQLKPYLRAQVDTALVLPVKPYNFSDFYSSIHHAARIGALVRPDAPILPNYHWLPVAYHGRTSSILASGTSFHRPRGQVKTLSGGPEYVSCRRLDYEAELAIYSGAQNALGEPIPIGSALNHVFGIGLLNDWSARDIQFWEYAPLGPFLGKSFATHLGDWVVTADALAPYWTSPPWSEDGERKLLPHLDDADMRSKGGLQVRVDVLIRTAKMRAEGIDAYKISTSNFKENYWTIAQLVAHQTSNGTNLEAGDVLGSGTLSGPTDDSRACLMEFTNGGTVGFDLPTGEKRTFVEDGDEIVMTGWCDAPGFPRIGLGEVTAIVLPAR
ncbi:fumarylacetoacetase [Pollutimonas thiosulfatoxidans]|uniref:fumarylacetoacetase n=1 Tax=Pollutimonas thiosulfatoxidans TaxID=2028345 RepID=A0A410GD57_9BURK|nr:fumarylacetoacetase [Pollutimonas thiosulfatoxidans]QAA94199.1 fumarylacetoacetase [Pollutimonas thiosulfatoxidans]